MQIRRIDIRDFRKIGRREITDLGDGLNIVVGDNEAGKSTILAALRAAFFERHRVGGAVADSMLPYGSLVRPTVSVDFEVDGRQWSLVKAFCQRPEASLTSPGERLIGDAVEDRLAELFGFTPPGRGASNPRDHHGIHGLLWIEQGMRPNLGVGAGRDTLAAALEREVGQVTGGDRGRALVAAAIERRDRFWDKRDKPRGILAEARRNVEVLEGEQAALLLRRQEHEARVARLETVELRLERHRRDDHLGRATAALEAARQDLHDAARRRADHEAATAGRLMAERAVIEARDRLEQRRALVSRRETARSDADRVSAEADEVRLLAARHATDLDRLRDALDAVRATQSQHEIELRRGEAARARGEIEATLVETRAKLKAAEDQEALRHAALARVSSITIDQAALDRLAALDRKADRARAERDVAGVSMTFVPEGGRTILVDGTPQAADTPLTLARDATLRLEGFGEVHLRPGGGAAALARAAEQAERLFQAELQRSGAASLAEARRLAHQRSEAQTEAASITRTLAILAPGGLDALRQAVAGASARLTHARPDEGLAPDDAALSLLQRTVETTLADVRRAETSEKVAAAASQQSATEAARFSERREAAKRLLQTLGDDLAQARLGTDDDLLQARLTAGEEALARAQSAEDIAAAASEAADAEAAQLTCERAERAEHEIRRDLAALEGEQRDLRVELRAVGQGGIEERLSSLEGELDVARARLINQDREAAASRLLHEALVTAQRESKEQWLGPVRNRVAPYLRLIHPESEIRMDDQTLEIEGLYRDGVVEQFATLSMGAREQVAVVARLALADVLKAAGHPATVILDDALVNTDDTRLDRMRNVLTRAARHLQIIIFTCRERDFLGLGATHRM